jgi:hypothetical protein
MVKKWTIIQFFPEILDWSLMNNRIKLKIQKY